MAEPEDELVDYDEEEVRQKTTSCLDLAVIGKGHSFYVKCSIVCTYNMVYLVLLLTFLLLSLYLQEVADVTVEKSAGGDGKDVKK